MLREFRDTLQQGIAYAGWQMEQEDMLNRCARFFQMLLSYNETRNLTAITDEKEAAQKHFLDSLSVVPYIKRGACVIDVGAGAGFPAVPLLLARPDVSVCMLDSSNKKVAFLNDVIQELHIPNAKALWARAEDAGKLPHMRASFDAALARAVAQLPVLLEYMLPFVKTGGDALALKGPSAFEEAKQAQHALQRLNARLESIDHTPLQGLEHYIVHCKKTGPTPAQFPRRAGQPKKSPL
ncbi:MAG: 16S rRNA (guanine(527)-N(7))-methyltransferase RsmG [Christensenellales bacterium]|jgi:16S rRNA (guanine527-N7)-methyltransferase